MSQVGRRSPIFIGIARRSGRSTLTGISDPGYKKAAGFTWNPAASN